MLQKWHIHSGCIYMIFLCCLTTCSLKLIAWGVPHFQLVHSNDFSLLCMDIAHVKLLDLSEIYSHWLHLWDFTSKDFLFTVYSSCNMLGQMLHLTSFSPGCIFICTFSVFAWKTKYSHLLHFCDLSHSVQSHDSSQHLLERRHNHTRCIYETSLNDQWCFSMFTLILKLRFEF